MTEAKQETGSHPEEDNHPLTPFEARLIFYAFCDGETQALEEEVAEIEKWRTEVQSGSNKRKSHELQSLRRRITQIQSLKKYAGDLFGRIPNAQIEGSE